MQRIIKYKLDDDGTYSAVITGISLGNDETQLLDEGYSIAVDVQVYDPYKITDKQRRKIFALVNDIEAHTGMPREYMRSMFMDYSSLVHGYEERLSLASCSKQQASAIIEVIILWTFEHAIPLNYKTSDLLKEDKSFLYMTVVKRKCAICGKHAELAHRYAIGRGRNRNKMDHYGNQVLGLCSSHHREQHQIGIDSFNKKYHLENSWVDVNEKINNMLKGRD